MKVEYYKYVDENNDCILKYEKDVINIEDEVFYLKYKLTIVLVKESGKYKKIGSHNATISMLKTSSSKETLNVDFEGDSGRNLQLNNYRNINFRGKGLFTYLSSIILNDTFKLLSPSSNCYVSFPDDKLTKAFEHEEGNYKRRNRAYEKLGFNVKFCDDEKVTGRLLDTNIKQLNLNTNIPNCLTLYENAYALIVDAIELIPFSNEIVIANKMSSKGFITKTKEVRNITFDVTKIIGTEHGRYIGKTWFEMICSLKCESYIKELSLDYNKQYGSINYYRKYKYREGDNPWGLKVYGDKVFISEGNHRSVISKFLYELGFIDKDIKGLRYVKYFDIDVVSYRKFWAMKTWLKRYYPDFTVNLNTRTKDIYGNKKENEDTIIHKTYFVVDFGVYSYEKDELKTELFENTDELKEYLYSLTNPYKERFSYKVYLLKKYIERITNKFKIKKS